MKRTLAWIGIIAMAIGFILLVYFTATGASANVIMATLFSMFVISFIVYVFLMVVNWKTNVSTKDETESHK